MCTIFALFGDDAKLAFLDNRSDAVFGGITIFVFVLFVIELIINACVWKRYDTMMFWLDFVAAGSLLPDIPWIVEAIDELARSGGENASLARAGRAARAGTRAGKVVRMLRVIRLVRLFALAPRFLHLIEIVKQHTIRKRRQRAAAADSSTKKTRGGGGRRGGKGIVLTRHVRVPPLKKRVQRYHSPPSSPKRRSRRYVKTPTPMKGMGTPVSLQESITDGTPQGNCNCNSMNVTSSTQTTPGLSKNTGTTPSQYQKRQHEEGKEEEEQDNGVGGMDQSTGIEDQGVIVLGEKAEESRIENQNNRFILWVRKKIKRRRRSSSSRSPSYGHDHNGHEDDHHDGHHDHHHHPDVSVVGQLMINSITQKVILCVLIMIIAFFFLGDEVEDRSGLTGLAQLSALFMNNLTRHNGIFTNALDRYKNHHPNLLLLSINGVSLIQKGDAYLRRSEILLLPQSATEYTAYDVQPPYTKAEIETNALAFGVGRETFAELNTREETQDEATRSLFLTLIVTALLATMSMLLSRDAHRIVIVPVERMLATIQRISENPLAELHELSEGRKHSDYETVRVHGAIMKMASLLQIGFGTAGAQIISKNVLSNGEIDPMQPGMRVQAVFGFCDIRGFTKATEMLQEDVMLFVNQIATVVHACVVTSGGDPNKNIGDGFFMVWKVRNSRRRQSSNWMNHRHGNSSANSSINSNGGRSTSGTHENIGGNGSENVGANGGNSNNDNNNNKDKDKRDRGRVDHHRANQSSSPNDNHNKNKNKKNKNRTMPQRKYSRSRSSHSIYSVNSSVNIHDRALQCCLNICGSIHDSPDIQGLLSTPRKRLFNFNVKMGFGVHRGWAIEGAIGSRCRVEASYLSPHVNIAARLESATKQYGVTILMSGEFVERLSWNMIRQHGIRKTDRVAVKGSNVPLDIYCWSDKISFDRFNVFKIRDQIERYKKYKTSNQKNNNNGVDVSTVNDDGTRLVSTFPNLMTECRASTDSFIAVDNAPETPVVIFRPDEFCPSFCEASGSGNTSISGGVLSFYKEAVELYLAGKWTEAYAMLLLWKETYPMDGAGQVLLRYMERSSGSGTATRAANTDSNNRDTSSSSSSSTSNNNVIVIRAPADWEFFRHLENK